MLFKREQFERVSASRIRRGIDWIRIPRSADSMFGLENEVEAFRVSTTYNPINRYKMYSENNPIVIMLSIEQGRVSFEPERVIVHHEWFQVFIAAVDIDSLTSEPYAEVICLFSSSYPVYVLKEEFIPKREEGK